MKLLSSFVRVGSLCLEILYVLQMCNIDLCEDLRRGTAVFDKDIPCGGHINDIANYARAF